MTELDADGIPVGSYMLREAVEARDLLIDELGEKQWTHLLDPVLTQSERILKSTLLLISTFIMGQQMEPGNFKIPVTLVSETIEAITGKAIR